LLAALALGFALFDTAAADPRADYTQALNACIAAANLEPSALNACRGRVTEACRAEEGDATFIVVRCISDENDSWERIIADVSERLRTSGDVELAASLDDVQRQWLAYRDAECSFRQRRFGLGSGAQYEFALCTADLAADRAIDLLIYEPIAD
jgi:uncharacterized protein YecT (DUF1311 family)